MKNNADIAPDLELLPTKTLPVEYKRFKKDQILFLDAGLYHAPNAKSILRIVALTPIALFVTDPQGKMDRATKYESIVKVLRQEKSKKKLFGSEDRLHFILKIDKEPDIHISFETEKEFEGPDQKSRQSKFVAPEKTKFERGECFAWTLLQMMKYVTDDPSFNAQEVDGQKNIKEEISTETPEGYLSPQELLRINNERKHRAEVLDRTTEEIIKMNEEIEYMKTRVAGQEKTLAKLEKASGVDTSVLREEHTALSQRQRQVFQNYTLLEMDYIKTRTENDRLQEQLREERANFELLVNSQVQDADNSAIDQQNEMMRLRLKAQKKETDKISAKLEAVKAQAQATPRCVGPDSLVNEVRVRTAEVHDVTNKWEKQMDAANKLEKFLATLNAELERLGKAAGDIHTERQEIVLLRQKQQLQNQQSASPAVEEQDKKQKKKGPKSDSIFIDDDDDLLGGGSPLAKPNPSSKAVSQIDDEDDDLLGDDVLPKKKPQTTDIDDDLL